SRRPILKRERVGHSTTSLIFAQWLWNLRLELGHALHPTPTRTTEFAPATSPEAVAKSGSAIQTTAVSYQPPVWAISRMGCIAGEHFTPQPDGTLQCPAGFPLYPQEHRPERDGSVPRRLCCPRRPLSPLPEA
ncbi:MAG: hypothetical protein J2P36_38160, partial [Ktedonobacteraceae bacterium]|nr:hypothetical protein [Ktedonobacteraceae bacterium]